MFPGFIKGQVARHALLLHTISDADLGKWRDVGAIDEHLQTSMMPFFINLQHAITLICFQSMVHMPLNILQTISDCPVCYSSCLHLHTMCTTRIFEEAGPQHHLPQTLSSTTASPSPNIEQLHHAGCISPLFFECIVSLPLSNGTSNKVLSSYLLLCIRHELPTVRRNGSRHLVGKAPRVAEDGSQSTHQTYAEYRSAAKLDDVGLV